MSTSTTLDSAHVLWSAQEPGWAGRPLIVLMNGWSYDERHLFGFADLVPGEMAVASVRAPHAEAGGYAWFPSQGNPIGDPQPRVARSPAAARRRNAIHRRWGAGVSTSHDDLIERSSYLHWPAGFDPDTADLFAHNAIVIDTPAASIWAKLTDAAAWPAWYSNASDVVVDGPSGQLGRDVTFTWTTFGLKIASTVAEFVPRTRLGWSGTGDQLRAYHTWLFAPCGASSAYVVMEEIAVGYGARHLARTSPGHLHRGYDLWNISLKFACEG